MSQAKNKRIDAKNNKDNIIKAASILFAEQGVENVSMQKIAQTAKVGQGTLYRHFKNKSALCLELMDEDVEMFFHKIAKYLEENAQTSAQSQCKDLIRFVIDLKEDNLEMLTTIESAGDKGQSFLQTPFYQRLQEVFAKQFSEISSIKDPEFHADILLNTFSSDIYNYQRFKKGLTKENLAVKISNIFLRD